jgi:hypothetical protein
MITSLTTYLHLVSKSRVRGVVSPLHHIFSERFLIITHRENCISPFILNYITKLNLLIIICQA